jgi:hypothetical protein
LFRRASRSRRCSRSATPRGRTSGSSASSASKRCVDTRGFRVKLHLGETWCGNMVWLFSRTSCALAPLCVGFFIIRFHADSLGTVASQLPGGFLPPAARISDAAATKTALCFAWPLSLLRGSVAWPPCLLRGSGGQCSVHPPQHVFLPLSPLLRSWRHRAAPNSVSRLSLAPSLSPALSLCGNLFKQSDHLI